jgi:hypothetical protein
MGASKKKDKPYEPWRLYEPLDPDRSMLEQWEFWTMSEPDDEERERMLDWLGKNIYSRPEARSIFGIDKEIITPLPKDKLH